MFLRVYDMPAPNESVAGRVCRAIAGLMIGGGWQEVIGWSPSDVRCCKENAVHVKMTKSWHVTIHHLDIIYLKFFSKLADLKVEVNF
jgi:hypothetical protein